ncbi:hypothetical protein L6452_29827 [Arctium lappa]|uniref:Uncharacterized protein n=1 Tax=Arctium lappa TaxID=4217 RepID=A0ACB8ZHF5_ARCLA|nr:hypothetical protein L6452_29827 [Arctium lappa]
MATCSSTENRSVILVEEKAMQYYLYPPPIARYEDVIANPKLFMDTLGNFHAAMGTKFMIPIVGGKDLDLHHLFVEVTSRGGIKKVLEEKKWKEVTNSFSFPPSATNASFILRKYYMSLIHHFEQVYYFKAKAWTPVSTDTWQSTKSTLTSTSGMSKAVLPLPEFQMNQMKQQRSPSAETQVTPIKRQRTTTIEDSLPTGFPVTGVIDGKFESGYLCTVMIGGEPLQGILYQCNGRPSYQIPDHHGAVARCQTTSGNATRPSTMVRRRRRKKSEIKKRDPAHPKPNRSGYNFFFAEQHARLKPLHPGKDRDISRMIGELWNNLTDSKKAVSTKINSLRYDTQQDIDRISKVYQEKAMKDKERYRIEMEHYRENLRTGRLVSNAVPLVQHLFKRDASMMEFNETLETDGGVSPQTPENELSSGDKCSFEDEAKTADTDSNFGLPLVGAEIVSMETVSGGLMKTVIGSEEFPRDIEMDPKESNQAESVSVHENESMHDEKTHHDKPTMPDSKDENENQHQFASMLEKMPVEFNGMVEHHRTLLVEELEQLTSETRVQYEPEPLDPKESAAVNMNIEQEPDVLQENIPKVIDDGAQIEAMPTNEVELRPPEGQTTENGNDP